MSYFLTTFRRLVFIARCFGSYSYILWQISEISLWQILILMDYLKVDKQRNDCVFLNFYLLYNRD